MNTDKSDKGVADHQGMVRTPFLLQNKSVIKKKR